MKRFVKSLIAVLVMASFAVTAVYVWCAPMSPLATVLALSLIGVTALAVIFAWDALDGSK